MKLIQAASNQNAFRFSFRTLATKLGPAENVEKKKPEIAYKDAKKFREIPGPLKLPYIGTLWAYYWPIKKYSFKTLHLTYEKMYKEYGLIVRENQTPIRTMLHLFAAEDIATVYAHDGRMPMRMSHQALGKYRRERPHLYAREGLLSSNNREWQSFRELFQTEISGTENVKYYQPALEDCVDEIIATIPRRLDQNNEISILPLFYRFGLEAICRIALNKRVGCLELEVNKEANTLIEMAEDTHIATYMTENLHIRTEKYHKMLQIAQDAFTGIVGKYLKEALRNIHKEENRNSMLAIILAKHPDVDKKDVFTIIVDAILGGIDNTSCALTMCLYNLARHKREQDILREEIMEYMPTKDVRLADLVPQKWKRTRLDAVISESHRMTPATLANGRITQKDLVLSGYQVPAGTLVLLQHQVASSLERHFVDAHLFKPDRYLRSTIFNSKTDLKIPMSAARPFGSGSRLCIGFNLAKMELSNAIVKILRNYELSYHHEEVGFETILMNKPDKPVKIRFRKIEY